MTKYRKKPVVIEAFHFLRDPMPDWFMDRVSDNRVTLINCYHREGQADIKTLEGTMTANAGDWIIKGVKGELYPIKDEIFRETYEPAETRVEKPAIAELEAILNEPSTPVHINSDGSVTVETK